MMMMMMMMMQLWGGRRSRCRGIYRQSHTVQTYPTTGSYLSRYTFFLTYL